MLKCIYPCGCSALLCICVDSVVFVLSQAIAAIMQRIHKRHSPILDASGKRLSSEMRADPKKPHECPERHSVGPSMKTATSGTGQTISGATYQLQISCVRLSGYGKSMSWRDGSRGTHYLAISVGI